MVLNEQLIKTYNIDTLDDIDKLYFGLMYSAVFKYVSNNSNKY